MTLPKLKIVYKQKDFSLTYSEHIEGFKMT